MDATKTKPFNIDKKLVYDAYKAVKANAGAAGVDGQSLEMFDKDLMRNLYKIWNRMSSGSYFPPPVRAVPIPKKSGGQRILGVPTVADRVAQMVVKKIVEREVEPIFLPEGAQAFLRDLPQAELHRLDSGHFALEDKADEMVPLMREFLGRHLSP